MNMNNLLETEEIKYIYEQAYALHRHDEIPSLFLKDKETSFSIADDAVRGWDIIDRKFREDLYYVSPGEDSFHTGWQICVPLLWKVPETEEIAGVFPTFGYLILSLDPAGMKPPYQVLSTMEMWKDRFAETEEGWKIKDLLAKFMIGQCVWRWDPSADTGLAVQHRLRTIPHPYLGNETVLSDETQETAEDLSAAAMYGIQFAQSLYTLLWQCGRQCEIPEQVFSDSEDISVWYDGIGKAEGRIAVQDFFRFMKEKTEENGGFLRMDMPATQWIEISEDGQEACGHWNTFSRKIIVSDTGNRYTVFIGRFTNVFCLENGVWRLKTVRWEELTEFDSYQMTADMHLEGYRKDPASWINDLPGLTALSSEGITKKTCEILRLRNEIFSWFGRYEEDTGVFPCKNEDIRDRIRDCLHRCGFILATSPVIRMEDQLSAAEAFFSVSLLRDSTVESMTDIRGSIGMQLERGKDGWTIREFAWYPYASLDPWTKENHESPVF